MSQHEAGSIYTAFPPKLTAVAAPLRDRVIAAMPGEDRLC